jgi:hypothetical protein
MSIPTSSKKRIIDGMKKYKSIMEKAESQDVNESDTVTILTDIFADVLGYDKYEEITSELAIKKSFCDIAIKLNDKVKLLIEVKSAATNLKENHLTQAVNYGANSGIDWVILTNGVEWKVFKILFTKPVEHELVYCFNFLHLNAKKDADIEMLYMLSRESLVKSKNSSLDAYHAQRQLMNKVMLGQIILSQPILDSIRKVLKKLAPEAKVTNDELADLIADEVLKREVSENEKASEYRKKISKALIAKPAKPEKENTV